jgi:hypothetical protein
VDAVEGDAKDVGVVKGLLAEEAVPSVLVLLLPNIKGVVVVVDGNEKGFELALKAELVMEEPPLEAN